jgi:hypothetical protein
VLRVTQADTVLLYSRNNADDKYFLRDIETSGNKPDDFLTARDLSATVLPRNWSERMEERLFFSSNDPEELRRLNVYHKLPEREVTHEWCLGAAIYTMGEIDYYMILGFIDREPTIEALSTTYYYWLQCEALLREILPEIHQRYLESSSAWNALVKSVRPIHPIVPTGSESSPIFKRRGDLRLAMASVNIGDFMRQAVGMSLVPVRNLYRIREHIQDTLVDLRAVLENERRRDPTRGYLLDTLDPWPVIAPPSAHAPEDYEPRGTYIPFQSEGEIYCAFHLPVLEFITYETLCNTLSYYENAESIFISIQFRRGDPGQGVQRILVDVRVENDVHPHEKHEALQDPEVLQNAERKPTGVQACEMAAEAVGGSFQSRYDPVLRRRVTLATLPAYRVPSRLQERLRDYLS